MADVSIATIRSMLQARVDAVVRELVPGGIMRSGLYEAPNPTRGDRHAGSFKIYMRGATAGKFVDYAGVNAPFIAGGDRGDVIDLIAYVAYGSHDRAEARKKAIAWAKDFLGLAELSVAERERLTKLAHARKLAVAAKHQDEEERKRKRAFDLFMQARVGLAGTPADAYLLSREIDIRDIPTFNHQDIRFHPGLEYFQAAEWGEVGGRRVKLKPGPAFPAIVCGFRNRGGAVTGVHCTYLQHDGAGKADVPKAKLMLGTIAGSVVRVAHGRGNVPPEAVTEQGYPADLPETVLAEGLEDCTTLASAAPEARVWMTGSLGNLGNVYVDHPCVGDVIVARDNDWQSPQAVRQFEHGILLLEAHGKPISQMAAIAGKDFNDLWRF
ncbi:toprim domain-containing protein [Bosea sp. (in: a-proteobacteria)]|uniref:DUF7146 domain-containing protein n=1 Tax=Bosea sp. (in: a-proteobacteria) TaxID=1871050 RepID=UPI002601D687|nr:toprim domain-containing protein [Bosea sp. (in: a-proteobacteria)]MCO5091976.1 toprim domain-containing protein [Bosea sp. (in: a-proteobacteria)]